MKGKLGVVVLFFVFLGTSLYSDYFSDLLEKGKQAVTTTGKDIIKTVGDTAQTLVKTIADPVIQQYVATLPMKKDNPYATKVAQVRVGTDIPEEEKQFVRARWSSVKSALQNLGLPTDKELRIGVVCSGGGVRAEISSVGAFVGLEKTGILPAVTYVSMLSGSTWNLPWWSFGNSIAAYKSTMIENVKTGLTPRNTDEVKWIVDMLLTKYSVQRPMSAVDLFNMLLVNTYYRGFGAEKFRKTLDTLPRNGSMPFPICTAALIAPEIARAEWMEFTQFEIGSEYLNAWVPTWGFNRKFSAGKSEDFHYERFSLGTFGTAAGINLQIVYEHAIKKKIDQLPAPLSSVGDSLVRELLQKKITVPSTHVGAVKDLGVLPMMTEFNNFTKGMSSGVKLADRDTMLLTDAGVLAGTPVPPLLRESRHVDLLIILDYSAGEGVKAGNELKKIVNYAKANNLPFPNVDDFSAAGKRTVSVFKDSNPQIPVVVYVPRTVDRERWEKVKDQPEFAQYKPFVEEFNMDDCVDKGFCNTLNFEYTADQANKLSGYTEYCVVASKQELIDAIKFAAERKK